MNTLSTKKELNSRKKERKHDFDQEKSEIKEKRKKTRQRPRKKVRNGILDHAIGQEKGKCYKFPPLSFRGFASVVVCVCDVLQPVTGQMAGRSPRRPGEMAEFGKSHYFKEKPQYLMKTL